MLPEGEHVTVSEAAERLGISLDGVRKRIQRGSLTHYKDRGRVKVILPPPEQLPALPDEASSDAYKEIIGPYVRHIEELCEQIGALRAQLLVYQRDLRAAQRIILQLGRQRDDGAG